MKKFFPYNPASTQVIELEAHKIVGGKIRLNSIPKEGSLTVRGFVEAQSAAHLQSNEFFCSYRADTQYREANCLVFFYAGRSGQTVYCSYITVGTVVTADDMNEIGDFMTAANKNFDDNKLTHTELKNLIAAARNEARTSLTEHNQNVAAHSDIRDSVRDLNISNTEAHIAIRSLINNLDADLRQHKADEIATRNQALLEHNSDGTAHSDIATMRKTIFSLSHNFVDVRRILAFRRFLAKIFTMSHKISLWHSCRL